MNTDTSPPSLPLDHHRSEQPGRAERDAPAGLKATMVVLAILSVPVFTAVGAVAGLYFAVALCLAEGCGGRDLEIFLLPLVVGFLIGGGLAWLLRSQRAWFYRHPAVVWVLAACFAVVGVFGLGVVFDW